MSFGFVNATDLEYQDFVRDEVLHRMNGPVLRQTRDQGGFGTHEFEFDAEGVDYSQVDLVRYHSCARRGQSGRGPARWCAGSPLAVSAVSSFVPV